MYSSATIVVGNPGQGNYVAGNIYLQRWRSGDARRAAGAVHRLGGDQGRGRGHAHRRAGVAAGEAFRHRRHAVGRSAGRTRGRMLACEAVAVSGADQRARLAEMMPAAKVPRFAQTGARGRAGGRGRRTRDAAAALDGPARKRARPLVVDVLKDHLARILGTAAGQVDIERAVRHGAGLADGVELATSLEREVGRPVSVMQMIQASSAAAVADIVIASLEPAVHG